MFELNSLYSIPLLSLQMPSVIALLCQVLRLVNPHRFFAEGKRIFFVDDHFLAQAEQLDLRDDWSLVTRGRTLTIQIVCEIESREIKLWGDESIVEVHRSKLNEALRRRCSAPNRRLPSRLVAVVPMKFGKNSSIVQHRIRRKEWPLSLPDSKTVGESRIRVFDPLPINPFRRNNVEDHYTGNQEKESPLEPKIVCEGTRHEPSSRLADGPGGRNAERLRKNALKSRKTNDFWPLKSRKSRFSNEFVQIMPILKVFRIIPGCISRMNAFNRGQFASAVGRNTRNSFQTERDAAYG